MHYERFCVDNLIHRNQKCGMLVLVGETVRCVLDLESKVLRYASGSHPCNKSLTKI